MAWKNPLGSNAFDRINEDNQEIIKEYVDTKYNEGVFGDKSRTETMLTLSMFAEYIQQLGIHTILDITQEHIRSYYSHAKSIYSFATTGVKFSNIKTFYGWCVVTAKLPSSPFPQFKLPTASGIPRHIPTADEIFKIRSAKLPALHRYSIAVGIEWLVSSGMRIGELMQIRVCDINWNPVVLDKEKQGPSSFVGASVDLSPFKGYKVKGGRRRIVYISTFAAKLTLRYMEHMGIPKNANVPLLPMTRQALGRDLYRIAGSLGMLNTYGMEIGEKGRLIKREQGFVDIKDEALEKLEQGGLSPLFKKKLKKTREVLAHQSGGKLSSRNNQVGMDDNLKAGRLSPHALRHFFGVLMWYRDYEGGRGDQQKVRHMLGHRTFETTNKYVELNKLYIQNERQWKRIMLGNGYEYKYLCRF